MQFNEIQNHSIIIAPMHLHHKIRTILLKQKNAVIDIQIHSIDTLFCSTYQDVSNYTYYQKLNEIKDKVNYQKHSITSLSFISELKSFITSMKQFDITYDKLPIQDEVEKELAFIIKHVYDIPLSIDIIKQNLSCFHSNKHMYILDTYTNPFEQLVHQQLYDQGAICIPYTSSNQQIQYYSILNPRKEVEALAQYIVEHNIPVDNAKISILSSEYTPFIKHIFNYYQIPIQLQNDSYISFIQQKWIYLLQYVIDSSTKNTINVLKSNVFKNKYINELIEYIQIFECSLVNSFTHVNSSNISNNIINSYDYEQLKTLETKAEEARSEVYPLLKQLLEKQTIEDILITIDEYLIQYHDFKDKQDRSIILTIRQEMRHSIRLLQEKQDLTLLLDILYSMSSSYAQSEGIPITTLSDSAFHYEYHFVLGCTQTNYPAMNAFNGIFKEDYYDCIPPLALENRYHLHIKNLNKQLHTSNHLICFYPLSTFDGKGKETSLELDNILGMSPTSYPLIETYQPYTYEYQLDKQYASALYLKEDGLHGSISSLETYAKCPYSYFLKYGLKLKDKVNTNFDETKAGTLVHYMMESLLTTYDNEYTTIKKEEIQQILQQQVEELITLYPNKHVYLNQLRIRLLDSIVCNLKVLEEQEQSNSLKKHYSEYKFNYTFNFTHSDLHLYGFVDRIDYNADFFRIIDYKSSAKTLKEDLVFSAVQLQLMTYLVVMEELLHKQPLGSFYYNLSNSNTKMEYAKLKKRPLEYQFYKEDDKIKEFYKSKKLDGWITSEHIEVLDDAGCNVKGTSITKSKGLQAKTIYRFETIKSCLTTILEMLSKQILDGDISCVSVEHACTYCPYDSICLHANHPKNKKEMVDVEEDLYIKGGRKNA